MKLKVLLIGSGGRESALAWKIKQSPLLSEFKVFPGNGGFQPEEILPVGSIDLKNKFSVQNFIKKEKFDFVIVGPEEPLVDGITDWLTEIHVPCFGPSAYCAQLEGSKDFAKSLMKEFGVPTARYSTFTNFEDAKKYIESHSTPIVVKADGLAAGKGVMVCKSAKEAIEFIHDIFIAHKFGKSGNKVVIEEFLDGEEASIFGICDGSNFLLLPPAQDHKRAFDNDEGPNTGGMGAYSPTSLISTEVLKQIQENIFQPMLAGLQKKGYPYKGLLYAGLMISKEGKVNIVEFNCRFGDPETQAILPLIEDDLLEVFYEASTGKITKKGLKLKNGFSTVVVLAAKGYPDFYEKGIDLFFPPIPNKESFIFHAGTVVSRDGILKSNGGRIAGIVAIGNTLKDSIEKVYNILRTISSPKIFYRTDIGKKGLF
ncbi:MAG: phosphoribosylamine--glycine ligase [Leptospiraceae bacterium]|nr:phosphoribosylamine--glycine ligase [Leptospiraceae bacterium]MCK6380021.1 phosphoribosylamine--glycine ligase [Leptospiraceae bacterium]NUM40324.1 phosphoribosylamine--glycine ligase [Leptospiraceae bacterium]